MLKVKHIPLTVALLYSGAASAVTEIKCYVELSNEADYIYVLSVAESDIDMEAHKQEILGTEVSYRSASKNARIESVVECRSNDESFVNVNAVKLDETRPR